MAKYLGFTVLLLVYGVILLGNYPEKIMSAPPCPFPCFVDVEYVTCPSSGDKKLDPQCSCCLAPKNCTLHLADGTLIQC
ncbi:hypothetical protein CJ030_MR8G002618 [Morella rubra]|uniref:Uncharacterized protein n=1 Tax=Morella rubra TaxID=262757 RepID=A0A6A1V0G1_9ROSI|nr:hypothetical protein CJ030_MR8G027423 [Morella rubra]KAB1204810.1 hypothetical protein CJ030_MR8G002618 [Morella rubra]